MFCFVWRELGERGYEDKRRDWNILGWGGRGGESKPKHPKSLTLCLYGGKWMEGEEEGKRGERKRW